MTQNSARRKHKILAEQATQYRAVSTDYRNVLRRNLLALLAYRGESVRGVRAVYLDGPKKGDLVHWRSIQNWTTGADAASSPSLDGLAALADYFGIEVWQLLVPGMRPEKDLRPVCVVSAKHRRLIQASDEPEEEVSPLTEEVAREIEQEHDNPEPYETRRPTTKRRSDSTLPAVRPASSTKRKRVPEK